jgi:hypothetical protein
MLQNGSKEKILRKLPAPVQVIEFLMSVFFLPWDWR